MISAQTNDMRVFREISDYTTIVNNAIDGMISLFEDAPAWSATCAKIKAIKLFQHTSIKYKAFNELISEYPYCIVNFISKSENVLIKRIDVKNPRDPVLNTLNDTITSAISLTLKNQYITQASFAIISACVKEALSELVKLMDRIGMGGDYEYQLRILDGETSIGERLKYMDWFRRQKLALMSPTAMAAFSMCVNSVQEMNEEELRLWKARYGEMCSRFKTNPRVVNHLTSLKNTNNRNCTCVVV